MMEQHICSRGLGQTPASGKDIYFSIACWLELAGWSLLELAGACWSLLAGACWLELAGACWSLLAGACLLELERHHLK